MGQGGALQKNSINTFMIKYFYPLLNQNKNIILLLHEKAEILKRKGESERTVYNVTLPGQTATLVVGAAYTIARIYIDDNHNNQHYLSFSPSIDNSGTRSKALAGKIIPLSYNIMVETIEKYKE